MGKTTDRLASITIDDSAMLPATPEVEQDRRVAVFDLLEDNSFVLPERNAQTAPDGPYALLLTLRDNRLVFDISTEGGEKIGEFHLSMGPFRQTVKDYFQICASYVDAVKRLPRHRSKPSTWPGAASTTRARAPCRSGWKARPRSTSTPRAACSP